MHAGTMIFLFDSRESCQESWEINVPSSEEALRRLNRIAQARLALLASNVRIVKLKVNGQPQQDVRLKGTGGAFSHPREAVTLRYQWRQTGKRLRGVPNDIFSPHHRLTPVGSRAFQTFSKVLQECGCVILRKGEEHPEAITMLEPTRKMLKTAKTVKKLPLWRLQELLGNAEAQQFWATAKTKG
jgi:hypothetical protein